jgi:hypothetical protein
VRTVALIPNRKTAKKSKRTAFLKKVGQQGQLKRESSFSLRSLSSLWLFVLFPFGNLLVMMQPEPLQLHPIKDGFGGRRFQDAGQGRTRFREKLFADKRVCIVHITGSPPPRRG